MEYTNEREESLWNTTEKLLLRWKGAPPSFSELKDAVKPPDRGEYAAYVERWMEEGRLASSKKNGLALPGQLGMAAGTLQRNPRGFAFLLCNDGGEDVFITADHLAGAMHGDTVLVLLKKGSRSGMRREGKVLRVLRRAHTRVVGTLRMDVRGNGTVTSDDPRLGVKVYLSKKTLQNAKDGMKVVADIRDYPDAAHPVCRGTLAEIIGAWDEKGVDITSIVRSMGLEERFPAKVTEEADALDQSVAEKDCEGRLDLRNLVTVTIDGDDSKDFDDAVSLIRLDNGHFQLGVHIADVSAYVSMESALDQEAFKRGNSTYLPDRVIPMLPFALSNGICSLNPKVDRLTLSCLMEMDGDGNQLDFSIHESVIHSHRRMTYSRVNAALAEDAETLADYDAFMPMLRDMAALSSALEKRRFRRGALDLDIPESKIILDENGKAVDVVLRQRGTAERMIESFMLAANETVAAWLCGMQVPAVYRIHENPDPAKMQDLDGFVAHFGCRIHGLNRGVTPRDLAELLRSLEEKKEADSVKTVLLRSLQKARYAPQDSGHFGLAAPHYCHFTSPIRRYADLMVHRSVRGVLQGKVNESWIMFMQAQSARAAVQASECEVNSMKAEREADDMKMAEYMQAHIGDHLQGQVSGVTEFGIFVQLTNGVEGLVRLSGMEDDYYELDEKTYTLVGRHTGKKYALGQSVRVVCTNADPVARQVDFVMDEP